MSNSVTRDRLDTLLALAPDEVSQLHPTLGAAYGTMLQQGLEKAVIVDSLSREYRRPIAAAHEKLDRITTP